MIAKKPCPTCKGSGKVLKNTTWEFGCPTCKGRGEIEYLSRQLRGN